MKAAIVITLACVVCSVVSQSYHFSNGWNPGKRSSLCTFSPYIKSLISKLVENEVHRLKTCTTPMVSSQMEYFPMDKEEEIPVSRVNMN